MGAKRAREHHILLHAAVRAKPASPQASGGDHRSCAEAVAVAAALSSTTGPSSHDSRGGERREPAANTDASHQYAKAVVTALSFCLGQLGGVRMAEKGAIRLLSAAWEDVRGPAPSPSRSTPESGGKSQHQQPCSGCEKAAAAKEAECPSEGADGMPLSRTLRLVVAVDGLGRAAGARLVRAACVCVQTIAVPLDISPQVLVTEQHGRHGKVGGKSGRMRVRILHDVALRVVRA